MMSCVQNGCKATLGCLVDNRKEILLAGAGLLCITLVALGALSVLIGYIPQGGWACIGTGTLGFAAVSGYFIYTNCPTRKKEVPPYYTHKLFSLFEEGSTFALLPRYFPRKESLDYKMPTYSTMSHPLMKGVLPNTEDCLHIQLESHEEIVSLEESHCPSTCILTIFHQTLSEGGKWLQYSEDSYKPALLPEAAKEDLGTDISHLFDTTRSEEDPAVLEREKQGVELVKELLKNREVTDLDGHRWRIKGASLQAEETES